MRDPNASSHNHTLWHNYRQSYTHDAQATRSSHHCPGVHNIGVLEDISGSVAQAGVFPAGADVLGGVALVQRCHVRVHVHAGGQFLVQDANVVPAIQIVVGKDLPVAGQFIGALLNKLQAGRERKAAPHGILFQLMHLHGRRGQTWKGIGTSVARCLPATFIVPAGRDARKMRIFSALSQMKKHDASPDVEGDGVEAVVFCAKILDPTQMRGLNQTAVQPVLPAVVWAPGTASKKHRRLASQQYYDFDSGHPIRNAAVQTTPPGNQAIPTTCSPPFGPIHT